MRPRTLAAPLLLTIACAALTPTNASAQGADTSVDAAAEAKRQFVLGRQAFDAKRYADAAQNFEAAAAYKPHPVAFYTAAVAWELVCTTAPDATARRNTAPARTTVVPACSGWRRNQQSYTDTRRGRRVGGTT